MILFGHPLLPYENFYHITEIDAIKHTPSNSMLYVEFNENSLDIIHHCQENNLVFALHVSNLKEVIFASNFSATYIVVDDSIVKLAQKAADDYLFDAKILCQIVHDDSIETLATLAVDGVIFKEAVIKIS